MKQNKLKSKLTTIAVCFMPYTGPRGWTTLTDLRAIRRRMYRAGRYCRACGIPFDMKAVSRLRTRNTRAKVEQTLDKA